MKKFTAVYFSPTQGTKKYVEAITERLDENYRAVDLTRPLMRRKEYAFGPDDVVVFGAPVYAGRLPLVDGGIFNRIQGNGAIAVINVTYGNREFDDALLELKDLLEAQGFRVAAAAAWLAQHTYTDKLATGRPDQADLAAARDFADRVAKVIEKGSFGEIQVPGNFPYREAKLMPMETAAGENCSDCGLCTRVCPAGAINEADELKPDLTRCIGCLACEKKCPSGARVVISPALGAIREKLEPNFAGLHKEPSFYFAE